MIYASDFIGYCENTMAELEAGSSFRQSLSSLESELADLELETAEGNQSNWKRKMISFLSFYFKNFVNQK